LAFGPAKDWIGNRQVDLDIPIGMTLQEFLSHLQITYSSLPPVEQLSIALNENYVDTSIKTELKENDEIAIIPPVSGG